MAYMADIINYKINKKQLEPEKQNRRNERETNTERLTGYLVKVTVSHQLILMLQSVLEQCPYDGLQFRVGGQQVGAECF